MRHFLLSVNGELYDSYKASLFFVIVHHCYFPVLRIATGAISIFQVALGTDLSNVELSVSMTDFARLKENKQD